MISSFDIVLIPATVTHLMILSRRLPTFYYVKSFANFLKIIKSSVTHLIFDDDFDESIDNSIPNSITHLKFGKKFDRSIKDAIPSSVTHLSFAGNFIFRAPLPQSVTHLELGDKKYRMIFVGRNIISSNPYIINLLKYTPSVKEIIWNYCD
jgi:hypothetical protein